MKKVSSRNSASKRPSRKASGKKFSWPLLSGDPAKLGFDSKRLERVDRMMERFIGKRWLGGGIALVARQNRIVHAACYGMKDVENKQPMRENTIFRIYSMTKPITSVAALILYEEGAYMLHNPLKNYIPEFGSVMVKQRRDDGTEELVPPKRDITIHDIMTHTGGLSYDYVHEAEEEGKNLAEFIPEFCKRPLVCHPGERFVYSASQDVLGRLVEVVSGQTFDQFLQERIFKPLGMNDTGFYVPPGKADRLCAIYTNPSDKDMTIIPSPPTRAFLEKPTLFSGGGGLVSTTSDYLRFATMLLNKGVFNGVRILGRKTVELMTQDHLPPGHPFIEPSKAGYGLGVSVVRSLAEKKGLSSIGEFGWGGAACTEMWVDPQEKIVSLVMFQLYPKHTGMIFTKIVKDAMYQALV